MNDEITTPNRAAADPSCAPAPAGRSLRAFLFQLVAPPLLLLTLAGALIVFGQWSRERDAALAALAEAAEKLSLTVDLELSVDRSALDALAKSPLIDRGDWAGLYTQASRMAARTPGALIAPTAEDGQLVFNTAVPLGTPLPNLLEIERQDRHVQWEGELLPVSSQGLTRIAREQQRAVYSDLYFGVSIKRPALAVAVPVLRDGAVPYTLTFSFPPDAIEALLRSRIDSDGPNALVIDRSGRIIAARDDAHVLMGRRVPDALRPLIGRSSAAEIEELSDTDGRTQVVAAVTSPVSGWTIVVSTPADTVYAPVRRVLTAWLIAALLVLVAAWALAVRWSLRLAAPLVRLSDLAKARRPEGSRPAWGGSSIREIERLAQALQDGQRADQLHHEAVLKRNVAEASALQARRAADALRTREMQLQLALTAGRMGFWRADLAHGQVQGDALFLQQWDLPADQATIAGDTLMQRIHCDDRALVQAEITRQTQAARGHYQGEFRIVCADGSIRWIAAAADVVHDEEARPLALIGVNTDITERKRLEQQLRDNSTALEDASRRKDHFLAMLGHELRNPLSPISMAAELLQRRATEPEQVRSTAQVIARQVRHMVRLIDDLLDIARITQGKILLQPVTVELHGILRDALETARPLIDARQHRLAVAASDEPLHVQGDPTRLVQIASNLLTNAAKYTQEGGEINVRLARCGTDALIEVRDSGIGLPAHMLDSVFEAFTQSPESARQAQGGLGMGLAVVKRLVQMHGGTVRASSAGIGQGACFSVTLPLVASAAAVDSAPRLADTQGGSLRVLLVDDNRDAADSLAQLLALHGYATRVAYDARSALEAAQDFSPQVGILDIGLPDMDGRTLAAQLRAAPGGTAMLLIAATGYGRLSEAQPDPAGTDVRTAFDHLLVKPVDLAHLMSLLRSVPTPTQDP
jgi:signal transduction histidine kinase/ActR/RegA family two-component response regulator